MSFFMTCGGAERDYLKFNVECAINRLYDGIRVPELRKAILTEVSRIGQDDLYEVIELVSPLAKRTESAFLRIHLIQAVRNIPHQQRIALVENASAHTNIHEVLGALKLRSGS